MQEKLFFFATRFHGSFLPILVKKYCTFSLLILLSLYCFYFLVTDFLKLQSLPILNEIQEWSSLWWPKSPSELSFEVQTSWICLFEAIPTLFISQIWMTLRLPKCSRYVNVIKKIKNVAKKKTSYLIRRKWLSTCSF